MRLEQRRPTWLASTGSRKQRSTIGRPNSAAWTFRGEAAEGAGGREREAEEASSRADARRRRPSRAAFKKMVGPAAKRAAVAHLRAVMSLSERRACSIVGADRKMIRYRSSRSPDATLRGRLRDLANERRRFGYRRCSCCCGGRGSHRGSTGSTGFIAKKGSPSASGGLAARPWGPVPQS
ncbi:protein of unknown function [Bradyrhizobium vignae]|uniref:Transposase n=1 Tax=Bradyrhizobium vignae TaxID=1549949 RepID=A0A2U3Q6Q0_9BRAD|nr:protein of unknown function [Bradyrhizobium vignae]